MRRFAFLSLVLLLSSVGLAHAQTTYVWNGNSASTPNWSDGTNWVSGTAPVSSLTNTLLVLDGSTQTTNTLDANLSVNSLTFAATAGAFTIGNSGGAALTLGSGGLTVASGNANAQTISAPITLGTSQTWANNGTGLLTVGGNVTAGAFVLTVGGSGNTTFSGTLSGTTTGSSLVKTGTGTVSFTATNALGALSGATLAVNGGTLNLTNQTVAGTFTKTGAGTLVFQNANAFTGGNVTVSGGTLTAGSTTLTTNRRLSIASGATFNSAGTLTVTVNGTAGYVAVAGPGTLAFTNTASSAAAPDLTNTPGASSFYGFTISAALNVGTGNRWFNILSNNNDYARYGVATNGADWVQSGAISGSATLNFNGSPQSQEASMVLNAANTGFTGAVNIVRGALISNNTASLSSANAVTFSSAAGNNAYLYLFGKNLTIGSLNSGTTTGGQAIRNGSTTLRSSTTTQSAATLTVTQTTDGTFAGVLADGPSDYRVGGDASGYFALNLTKAGANSLTLSGASTFTGSLTVNAGTLALAPTGSVATNAITVNNGGTLALRGAGNLANAAAAVTVNAGGLLDVSGGYTLAAGRTLIAGRTSNFGNDVVGNLTLAGALNLGSGSTYRTATFANDLTLSGGTVAYNLSSSLTAGGGANSLIAVGGNLTLAGTSTLNISQPATGLTNGNYTLFTYGGTLTGNASNLQIGGVASGTTRQAFTLDTASTAGSVLLNVTGSPANLTWTGGTNGNWDVVTTANNFSGAADNRFYNLDTVTFDDTPAADQAITLNANVTPSNVVASNSAQSYTISGTGSISGPGSLTKSGTGTFTLATNNTYTGGTTISGGTLQLGNGGTSGSIAGNVANNGTLAFNRSDSSTFAGAISGTGTVTQAGTGTTILTGANSYSGGTTISAGTLQANSIGAIGTGAIMNNAALVFNTATSGTVANVISGTGSVAYQGGATFTVNGVNTYTGGTTWTAGGLALGNASALGTAALNVSGAAGTLDATALSGATIANNIALASDVSATTRTILINGAAQTTDFTGIISGGSANTTLFFNTTAANSSGTIRLSGANTFAGAITLNRGTLVVNNAQALGTASVKIDTYSNTAGTLQFTAGGTFANTLLFTAFTQNYLAVAANQTVALTGTLTNQAASAFVKVGTGTLNLNGTVAASTTGFSVNAGNLNVNGNLANQTGATTVASGATLGGTGTVGGTITVNAGGTVRGDSGTGTGTLNAAGNVTVTGSATPASAGQLVAFVSATPTPAQPANVGADAGRLNLTGTTPMLTLGATGGVLANIVLRQGANALTLDGSQSYTVVLATVAAGGSFSIGGTNFAGDTAAPVDANLYRLSSSDFSFQSSSLAVDGGNNLVLTFTPMPVPEPLTVLAVGAAGLAVVGWRRNRKAV